MADIGGMFSSIGLNLGGGFVGTIITVLLGTVVLVGCGFFIWFLLYKRKRWNVSIEFKIPRNIREVRMKDGQIVVQGTLNKEWGKGFYNSKNGVVNIKRKGKKPTPMKPFDVKRFLSTGNILTVIQVGIDDYRPVLDESHTEATDDKTGEEAALLKARIDTSESKSWKNTFERESKQAYSIKNWISEHGGLVAMGLVLLMNLVGFAIVISRLPK